MSFSASAEEVQKGQFLGAKQVGHPGWFRDSFLDLAEDVTELAENNQGLAVYFYQNACPYCAKLINTNFGNPVLVNRLQKSYQVLAINMWGDREVVDLDGRELTEKEMAARWKVQFTPTFIFLDQTGKVAIRINGYRDISSFHAALDYLEAYPKGGLSYREYITQKNKPDSGALIAEEFFAEPPYALIRGSGSSEYLAVVFEAVECNACKDLHKVMQYDVVKTRFKKMETVQLDRYSDVPVLTPQGKKTTARQWADSLGVDYLPYIVIFAPDGQQIIRKEGMLKAFHTEGILEYALSESWKTQPSFQRFLEAYADTEREKGRDVDLWQD